MDVLARLEALIAAPKPWLVTTTYECGKVRMLRQPHEAMARNYASRIARNIGRNLIDRDTGATVRILSVDVDYLPETL